MSQIHGEQDLEVHAELDLDVQDQNLDVQDQNLDVQDQNLEVQAEQDKDEDDQIIRGTSYILY